MKSLYSTITQYSYIDGHIHLFDHEGLISPAKIDISSLPRCVCFSDISFRYINKYKGNNMIAIYDKFINKYYDPANHILLATGENAEDIIAIYEKYPDKIKGFGELKCYSNYMHGELPYGNLDWIRPVLDYNRNLGLPTYIHYNLEDAKRVMHFENLLIEYDFPIVLCHCGMYDYCDNDLIHDTLIDLMKTYNNLYIDISYSAVDYYLTNLNKLLEFDNKKVILGTDINPVIYRRIDDPIEHVTELYDNFYKLNRFGNFNIAIKNIFK